MLWLQSHRMTKLSLIKKQNRTLLGGVILGKNIPSQWLRQLRESNAGGFLCSLQSPPVTNLYFWHTHDLYLHSGKVLCRLSCKPCLPLPSPQAHHGIPIVRVLQEGRRPSWPPRALSYSFCTSAPFSSLLAGLCLYLVSASWWYQSFICLFTNLFNTNSTYQYIKQYFKLSNFIKITQLRLAILAFWHLSASWYFSFRSQFKFPATTLNTCLNT